MAKKQTKELLQTKSKFKLVGKVTRIDKDGAYREGEGKENTKNEGVPSRSIKFGVKTSETNENFVQMFAYEPKEVFLWSTEDHKEAKEKNREYKGVRIPYEDFLEDEEELREEGKAVLETRIGLSHKEIVDEKTGKTKRVADSHGELKYRAIKAIYETLDNDDVVLVEGDISYGEYTKDGKTHQTKNFNITKLILLETELDFQNPEFKEVAYYEQEFVVMGAQHDKKTGKTHVSARVIDYHKNYFPTTFVVNTLAEDGEEDADMVTLSNSLIKQVKAFDKLSVYGELFNRTIVKEVEGEEDTKKSSGALLGGRAKPSHAESYTARSYQQEMTIIGVEEWDKKFYSADDFVEKEEVITKKEEKSNSGSSLGGKSNKPADPFADVDVDDDDLPF